MNERFIVRDLKAKNRFVIDNKFYDEYVRILGTNALVVYCSLCRHADKNQYCYPAQKSISKKVGLSVPTIIEAIKVLEYFKIIKKMRVAKHCTNRYWLLDKNEWKKEFGVILNNLKSDDFKLFKFSTKRILIHNLNSLISNSKETQEKGNTRERSVIKKPKLRKDTFKKMRDELKDMNIRIPNSS